MPSQAYTSYLVTLLEDPRELQRVHDKITTGKKGRQFDVNALNRAVVVTSISAWEAYVEEVVRESVDLLRPAAPPLGAWPSWKAQVSSDIGRFNNPGPENVKKLIAESIGVPDITQHWFWANCSAPQATKLLGWALTLRHHVAHGVHPRPVVGNQDARWLPGFFERLGARTDEGIRLFALNSLGTAFPW